MSAVGASPHKVLIVEDDEDFRKTIGHALEEEGCSVRSAGNGADALCLLERVEKPCLILLDLMMPVMNGWQFLEKKKAENRLAGIPVVVMSAYLDMPGFAAPHLPVDATVKKPLPLDKLLETIDTCCDCQSH